MNPKLSYNVDVFLKMDDQVKAFYGLLDAIIKEERKFSPAWITSAKTGNYSPKTASHENQTPPRPRDRFEQHNVTMKNWIIMILGGGCTFVLPFLMVYLRGRLIGKILQPLVDIDGAVKKYGKPYLKSLMLMSCLFGLALTCFLLFGKWWLMVIALVAASLIAGIFVQTARAAKPKNYFLHVAEQLHHAGKLDAASVNKFRVAAMEVERRSKEASSVQSISPESAAPDENQLP
ncbi:MAG: hypothetical protein WCS94_02640 [Verrucomicrobiota bacterium]